MESLDQTRQKLVDFFKGATGAYQDIGKKVKAIGQTPVKDIVSNVSKGLIYNPESKRILPASPLYALKDMGPAPARIQGQKPIEYARSLSESPWGQAMKDMAISTSMMMSAGPTAVKGAGPSEALLAKAGKTELPALPSGKITDYLPKTDPILNLKRDVPVTDIHGAKSVIPAGEALTPYDLGGGKMLLKDGVETVVSKNQYANIKGNAIKSEAKPFAPELMGTEEKILGSDTTKANQQIDLYNKTVNDLKAKYDPTGRLGMNDIYQELIPEDKALFDSIKSAEKISRNEVTKFSQYTLPGGENYKEILIKAPVEPPKGFTMSTGENVIVDKAPNSFKSSHWDDPNVLAHVRTNERTIPATGQKVTFMEEAQSDWAREGRQKGFATEITKDTAKQQGFSVNKAKSSNGEEAYFINNKTDPYFYRKGFTNTGFDTEAEAWNTITKKLKETSGSVPSHPLLKDWQSLALKRGLKEAVDNGSDYFSWTTGEQQAARYNLSKQVDAISWKSVGGEGIPASGKIVDIYPNDGSTLKVMVGEDGIIKSGPEKSWIGKPLGEAIGKGVGEKILTGGKSGTLTGEGLNIGGEWAKNLYDREIPNKLKEITGQKPEVIDLSTSQYSVSRATNLPGRQWWVNDLMKGESDMGKLFGTKKEAQDWIKQQKTMDMKQQAVRITPELRAKILGEAPPLKQPSGLPPEIEKYLKPQGGE